MQKKYIILQWVVPKVDTYLYIPEAVGSVWFVNKAYIFSPIKFKQTFRIPLNMRGQEWISYMLYGPIPQ